MCWAGGQRAESRDLSEVCWLQRCYEHVVQSNRMSPWTRECFAAGEKVINKKLGKHGHL